MSHQSKGHHAHLSGENKKVIQPAMRPFTFLELAVELRIEIYRYALTCSEPIVSESNKLRIHEQDNPAVALLRTCKTIFSEGGQVFYGENDFRFQHEDFFFIPKLLPEHNFRWLKQLTMAVPFITIGCFTPLSLEKFQELGDIPLLLKEKYRCTTKRSRFQSKLLDATYIHYSANSLVRKLFLHIAKAPNLKQLNLAHRRFNYTEIFRWPSEVTERSSMNARLWLDNMQVLRDLKDLLTARPLLKIVLMENLLPSMQNQLFSPEERCNRIARYLRQIGVWDRRIVLLPQSGLMYDEHNRYIFQPIPQEITAENPDDFLLAMEPLFAGIMYGP